MQVLVHGCFLTAVDQLKFIGKGIANAVSVSFNNNTAGVTLVGPSSITIPTRWKRRGLIPRRPSVLRHPRNKGPLQLRRWDFNRV